MRLFNRILIKLIVGSAFVVLISIGLWVDNAIAVEIDPVIRTVPLNAAGEQITLTTKQLAVGQRKFNGSCAQCHLDGGTKTNPDVDLGPQTLMLATPPRDTIEDVVDYLNNPMTYDGAVSLTELHPSTQNTDLFPKMRDLTEEDLTAIAGYILVQPKIIGDQWAGGKPNR
ncbi:MAG: photosystem II cytochrome c-550 [Cyanobacteria bacterium P01_A01_bin.123]